MFFFKLFYCGNVIYYSIIIKWKKWFNLKKNNIIKENRDFERIIKNTKPFKYHNFLIFKENSIGNYKFGITVSKKTCNAVKRNKLKRQIKSIIDSNKYKDNFNCIILLRKNIVNDNYDKMKEDLNYCFKNIKILEGDNYEK